VIWNYSVNPQGNPALLFTGVAMVVAAIVIDGVAYRIHTISKAAGAQAGAPDETGKIKKGILLSVTGGVLMGMFFPLVEIGKKGSEGSNGMGPYAIGFVFSVGVFLSTFVFNAYFMKKPVQGKPIRFGDYFKGTTVEHFWGLVGGIVWGIGTLSSFVAASAPKTLQVGPAISYALGQGSTMVGAFWGVVVWKEFAGGGLTVKRLIALMFLLFVIGLAVVSIAPLYAAR
jgi:glucose uptake protein